MDKYADLKYECIAIGSLPHKKLEDAISMIKQYNYDIPFCPQLVNYSQNEDMLYQYLENMPAISINNDKIFINNNSNEYLEKSKKLSCDFEKILSDINSKELDKYCISKDFSVAFKSFIDFVGNTKPKYAKIQITGPFTLSVNIFDNQERKSCFDKEIAENITKILILKTLWQIREIKKFSQNTVPIVFIDEPTLAQLNNNEYEKLSQKEIIENIKKISDKVKEFSGLSAVHCCGNCNWSDLLKIGLNMINFDAFTYAKEMNTYTKDLKDFLENGGKLVWGIVPTLNQQALEIANLEILAQKFEDAKRVLIENGIDKELIENNSLISSSCGCATLSVELTEKTFKLAKDLSKKLKG